METTLTPASIAALFSVMLVGAAIPGTSVLAVSARSAAFGFRHGVLTTLGIVVGDVIFILIAIYGLSLLAEWMGQNFGVIKYLGGAYLIWLGIMIWRSGSTPGDRKGEMDSSLLASFLAGLLITLGDQKAILFYFSFFPAVTDLSVLSPVDTGIIVVLATFAISAAKLAYAFLADRASQALKGDKVSRVINSVAGCVIMGVGVYLILWAWSSAMTG